MTCMTLVLLGNYAQTGHFGGPLAYTPFNVVTHLAGRDRGGLHFDYRRPKHPYSDKFMLAAGHCAPDLLRAVDDLGRSAGPEVRGHGRSPLLRRPRACDVVGRRARLPARRRRARDAARRPRSRRSSAVRPGEGPWDSRAVRPHRIDGRHQRRQRRPLGRRPRDRGGQGRVLGRPRRGHRFAQDRGLRRRVRDVRRARSGAEDAGDGRASRQAAPHLLLRQQCRHRRRADRRRGAQQVRRRLRAARSVDVVRMERLHDSRRPRLRADPRRAADDGRLGPRRSPADDRHRQDDEGLLAGADRRSRSWATRAIRSVSR